MKVLSERTMLDIQARDSLITMSEDFLLMAYAMTCLSETEHCENKKVTVIKAMRNRFPKLHNGAEIGLKESKDLYEACDTYSATELLRRRLGM